MNQMQQQNQQPTQDDIASKLKKLKTLFENDSSAQAEFKAKVAELIRKF